MDLHGRSGIVMQFSPRGFGVMSIMSRVTVNVDNGIVWNVVEWTVRIQLAQSLSFYSAPRGDSVEKLMPMSVPQVTGESIQII